VEARASSTSQAAGALACGNASARRALPWKPTGVRIMADEGGMGFLGFVLGGVVVVLVIIAFVVYGGQNTGPKTVNLELPKAAAPVSR
jgi:hypothetical protein